MGSKWWHYAVAAVLAAAVIVGAGSLRWKAVRKYSFGRQGQALKIPWGQGQGQVSQLTLGEHTFGPRSFALLPNGGFVILDTYGQRLLYFNARDKLMRSAALDGLAKKPAAQAGARSQNQAQQQGEQQDGNGVSLPQYLAQDVAVDQQGNTYVLNFRGTELREYDPKGAFIGRQELEVPAAKGSRLQHAATRLEVASGRVMYAETSIDQKSFQRRIVALDGETASQLTVARFGHDGKLKTDGTYAVNAVDFAAGPSGRLAFLVPAGKGYQVQLFRSGQELNSFDLKLDNKPGKVHLAGLTKNLLIVSTNPGQARGSIKGYTVSGQQVFSQDVKWPKGPRAHRYVRVKGHSVYVLQPAKAGLKLVKWKYKSWWAIESR